MNNSTRYEELDSLRGLAAITVVFSHLSFILPYVFITSKLRNTPVHIFWAGHEAVILFFILSGFVLSLPYFNKKSVKYKDFLIKRLCRIYIPYIVSIILAMVLMSLFSRGGISNLSHWFNSTWTTPVSMGGIFNHIILIGRFNTVNFDPVIWSLIHEMRISLIFPFIMIFILRSHWRRILIVSLSIPVLFLISYYIVLKLFNFDMIADTFNTSSYFLTLHYISFFMIGALLAKYRKEISRLYRKFSSVNRVMIMIIALLAYTYNWWCFNGIKFIHLFVINDWVIAVGASLFIVFGMNSKWLKRILTFKPIHFTGKISYSLYLSHLIVIYLLINLLYGKLPVSLILLISFVVAFGFSSFMYYAIEKPSIKLGKLLTQSPKEKLKQNDQLGIQKVTSISKG